MRSLLRTIPLIGALLLSTAPVQAYETWEEFDKACTASEETIALCQAAIQYSAFTYISGLLCSLEHDGLLTTEQLTEWWDTNGLDPENNAFLKDAINQGVTPNPNCHIKPYTEIPFR